MVYKNFADAQARPTLRTPLHEILDPPLNQQMLASNNVSFSKYIFLRDSNCCFFYFYFCKLVIAKSVPFKVGMRNICSVPHKGSLTSQTLFIPQCQTLSVCDTKRNGKGLACETITRDNSWNYIWQSRVEIKHYSIVYWTLSFGSGPKVWHQSTRLVNFCYLQAILSCD